MLFLYEIFTVRRQQGEMMGSQRLNRIKCLIIEILLHRKDDLLDKKKIHQTRSIYLKAAAAHLFACL